MRRRCNQRLVQSNKSPGGDMQTVTVNPAEIADQLSSSIFGQFADKPGFPEADKNGVVKMYGTEGTEDLIRFIFTVDLQHKIDLTVSIPMLVNEGNEYLEKLVNGLIEGIAEARRDRFERNKLVLHGN